MKKEFLDAIYAMRMNVLVDIKKCEEKSRQIQFHCEHCEQDSNEENKGKLAALKNELSDIDTLIGNYLNIHHTK